VVGEGSARICQCTVGLASRRRLESHACRAQRCGWPGSSLEALHSATVLGSDPVAARLILERSTISRNLALMQNKGRVADARFICRVSGSRRAALLWCSIGATVAPGRERSVCLGQTAGTPGRDLAEHRAELLAGRGQAVARAHRAELAGLARDEPVGLQAPQPPDQGVARDAQPIPRSLNRRGSASGSPIINTVQRCAMAAAASNGAGRPFLPAMSIRPTTSCPGRPHSPSRDQGERRPASLWRTPQASTLIRTCPAPDAPVI